MTSSAPDVEAHADALRRIEPVFGFERAEVVQLGPDLGVVHHTEAVLLIVEARSGTALKVVRVTASSRRSRGPYAELCVKCGPEALTTMGRQGAELFGCEPVDDVEGRG